MEGNAASRQSRPILIVGFGGLLLLMAVAGFDALRALRQTEAHNRQIQADFLTRSRELTGIRSDLYLAGTWVRDFLLEPDPAEAQAYRRDLRRLESETQAEMTAYSNILPASDRDAFATLRLHTSEFWQSLDAVFTWTNEERKQRGYTFARDTILPQRTALLALADQIAATNERQLKAGSERVAVLFARARLRLTITLMLTLALGILLALYSSRRVLALQNQAARQLGEVARARAELKELSARLVEAQENERRAIARELHDEVGQLLSAVLVGLSNLAAEVPESARSVLAPHLDSVRKLLEAGVAEVRNMALLLRPAMLDDLGLVPALQWQARETARRTGMVVNVATTDVSDDLADEYKTCIYRLVQEALHNAAQHARARQVRIAVNQAPAGLHLSVQDDGRGFDPRLERGMGLLGMEERVRHLHGRFQITSEPGKGTLLAVDLPPAANGNGHA